MALCGGVACVITACSSAGESRPAARPRVQPPRAEERLSRQTILVVYGQPETKSGAGMGEVWHYSAELGASNWADAPVIVEWVIKFDAMGMGRAVLPRGVSARDYWVQR